MLIAILVLLNTDTILPFHVRDLLEEEGYFDSINEICQHFFKDSESTDFKKDLEDMESKPVLEMTNSEGEKNEQAFSIYKKWVEIFQRQIGSIEFENYRELIEYEQSKVNSVLPDFNIHSFLSVESTLSKSKSKFRITKLGAFIHALTIFRIHSLTASMDFADFQNQLRLGIKQENQGKGRVSYRGRLVALLMEIKKTSQENFSEKQFLFMEKKIGWLSDSLYNDEFINGVKRPFTMKKILDLYKLIHKAIGDFIFGLKETSGINFSSLEPVCGAMATAIFNELRVLTPTKYHFLSGKNIAKVAWLDFFQDKNIEYIDYKELINPIKVQRAVSPQHSLARVSPFFQSRALSPSHSQKTKIGSSDLWNKRNGRGLLGKLAQLKVSPTGKESHGVKNNMVTVISPIPTPTPTPTQYLSSPMSVTFCPTNDENVPKFTNQPQNNSSIQSPKPTKKASQRDQDD